MWILDITACKKRDLGLWISNCNVTPHVRCQINVRCHSWYYGQFSQRDEFQISWIRHSDLHILTVGRYTYTAGIEITELFILEGFSVDAQNCTKMCSLFSLDIWNCRQSLSVHIQSYHGWMDTSGNNNERITLIKFLISYHSLLQHFIKRTQKPNHLIVWLLFQ